ncbi:apolipoprotein N-acyltransferase [Leadbettera azotonutricia]|uniref:Apolipoprotein N-acyltransferase n=1 Tax=Leadbettera azotonutricia (strain ATCC BAA-888 / DSM 13862 / ZAS-9) TaxID=545695 RepID=F5YFG6_LEAAZ|nr:apolipoprotein N-acyltransferase [Leadbettera azotonutricia]AEF81948.1 apolipoprotein N-acyltransferase [Leadbettera azotonutricia ZAS-9]
MKVSSSAGFRSFLINLAAIAAGALLFAAAFPNLLFENGLPLLAWIAYVPVFWVIRRSGFGASVFWGALYGYGAYGLFNYWLSVFHPLAGLIVGSIYMFYLAALFPLLKLAITLYPKRGYLLQFLFWMGFEYLRTQGFLGYAYGITGYSQWRLVPVIQIASIAGVWGVSALAVFPSAWLAAALPADLFGRKTDARLDGIFKAFFKREKIPALVWGIAVIAALVYGFVSPLDYGDAPKAKLALIQHNTDPWRGGIEEYRNNYRVLKRLSDEALKANPDLDLVVWSETAFVPRIYWHQTVRDDPPSWTLVKELLDYLASQDVPFVIGNDDARKEPAKNPLDDNRVDYNGVMLFEKGEIKTLYRKLHLVPFTEHFPYKRQLPFVYDALINADTHFWETGNEATVFESRGIKFSTPICFEDTFGYLSREFVRNGAELIVNLSNDAWSHSLPAQNQHLSMAVFRAVENRRAMARSTASGQTCAIDPNGKVLAMAEPFTEAWLAAELPLVKVSSLYTRFGDWLPKVFMGLAFILLIAGIVSGILLKNIKNKVAFPQIKEG